MSLPIPAEFQPHTMTIRAYLGQGGMGATYADPVEVECFAEEEIRLVRGSDGAEVVSTAQITCAFEPAWPTGSLVSVWGMPEREVIATGRHEAPGWPAYQTLSLT